MHSIQYTQSGFSLLRILHIKAAVSLSAWLYITPYIYNIGKSLSYQESCFQNLFGGEGEMNDLRAPVVY
jgi:hypothetical protein